MNGIRKLMCSIACCFMIFSNAPVTILATETDEIMEETTVDEIENNTLAEETQNEIENLNTPLFTPGPDVFIGELH